MEPFDTIEYRGCTIELHADEDAQNPRHDMDWAGKVVIWSRDYSLSDKDLDYDPDRHSKGLWLCCMTDTEVYWDDATDEEIAKAMKVFERDYIYLGLNVGYRAEGVRVTTPFDPDSDDGLIFISKSDAIKEWGKKICTKDVRERALKYLKGEIETYDQYLRGEVFGYITKEPAKEDEEPEDAEEIDSCWGFYPDETDGFYKRYDYAVRQAKDTIDYYWNTCAERDQSGEHEFAGTPELTEAKC